jgi:hypothetical protein
MKRSAKNIIAFSGVAFISTCLFTGNVNAQMNERPWGFNTQNRASIAALIKQVEGSSSASTVTAGTSITNLICGGDGADASATGNSSCIILNNSDGVISVGQDAAGNQDANSETTETTNVEETINVDEVISALSGDSQDGNVETLSSLIE